jgi:WD40 repeat protein
MHKLRIMAVILAGFGALQFGLALPDDRLAQSKKDPDLPRLDSYGDLLPAQALVRLGTMRFRGQVSSVSRVLALSPDGKLLASAEIGSVVRLWEAATGRELRELRGQKGAIVDLAFSVDGKVLASASSDKSVRLWNVDTGKEHIIVQGLPQAIASLAFPRTAHCWPGRARMRRCGYGTLIPARPNA